VKFHLDDHIQKDPRILQVYLEARRLYRAENRFHHNFDHVLRDLYRALVIAETEASVDYSVLIPAVLLHDIGFFDPAHKLIGHDEAGACLAEGMLGGLGYEKETLRGILHCIRAHKSKAEIPGTLEAKVLYDADVLEKAGLFALILGGKLICEFGETLEDYLKRESADRAAELSRGFFTEKGRELDGGRLARTSALLKELQQEVNQGRKDYSVREADLWINPPA
jgi:uncharacterized protein